MMNVLCFIFKSNIVHTITTNSQSMDMVIGYVHNREKFTFKKLNIVFAWSWVNPNIKLDRYSYGLILKERQR